MSSSFKYAFHKTANFSFVGKKMPPQVGKTWLSGCRKAPRRQWQRCHTSMLPGLPSRKLAERRRNHNLYGHTIVSPLL